MATPSSAINISRQETAAKIRDNPAVLGAAPFIEDQALLIAGNKSSGAIVTGVLPEDERQVTIIASKTTAGSFDAMKPGEYGIVLGDELAKALDRIDALLVEARRLRDGGFEPLHQARGIGQRDLVRGGGLGARMRLSVDERTRDGPGLSTRPGRAPVVRPSRQTIAPGSCSRPSG